MITTKCENLYKSGRSLLFWSIQACVNTKASRKYNSDYVLKKQLLLPINL